MKEFVYGVCNMIKKISELTEADKLLFLERTKREYEETYGTSWESIEPRIIEDIENTFDNIPANFTIYNYVPQTQLLPEVDVFITHAGFNSTSEGLASGAAMVLVPQAVDQFDVARVVEKLNAGIALNKHEINITADIIKKAVDDAYANRENFKKGTKEILDSFEAARNDRKAIYAEIFA